MRKYTCAWNLFQMNDLSLRTMYLEALSQRIIGNAPMKLSGFSLETAVDSSKPRGKAIPQTLWDNIQAKHIASSKALAQKMQNNISSQLEFSKSKIQNADLMVLKGADMPAILIEVGYLTNPGDEKNLQNPEVLSDFARAICNGIDDYFQSAKR